MNVENRQKYQQVLLKQRSGLCLAGGCHADAESGSSLCLDHWLVLPTENRMAIIRARNAAQASPKNDTVRMRFREAWMDAIIWMNSNPDALRAQPDEPAIEQESTNE